MHLGTRGTTRHREDESVEAVAASYAPGADDRVVRLAEVAMLVVFGAAMTVVRIRAAAYSSLDYGHFFSTWYWTLETRGFAAFGTRFADYNPPYLYLLWLGTVLHAPGWLWIKLVPNVGDLALAWGVYRVVANGTGAGPGDRRLPLLAALTTWALPGMWLNSSAWGQTDSLCTTFLVWSLAMLQRGRQRAAWVLFGVGFAFKAQALFFLPFLALAFVLNRRRQWTAPPLALVPWVLSGVPVVLAGRGVGSYVTNYLLQTGHDPRLTITENFWGFFVIGRAHPLQPAATWFALAALVLTALAVVRRARWDLDPTQVVVTAAALTLMTVYFLPGMRNRYFHPAEVLVLVYAFLRPQRWWLALVMSTTTTLSYIDTLFREPRPLGNSFWGLPMLLVLAVLVRDAVAPNRTDADTTAPPRAAARVDPAAVE